MTTSTLSPATVPAPASLALSLVLAVAGAVTQLLRYLVLVPALLVAAVHHHRRSGDPCRSVGPTTP